MSEKWNKLMVLSFVGYIATFFVLQIITPEKTFSDLENRNLQAFPKLTEESFLSGDFGADFEVYIADQFPGREHFISIKSYSELALQKKENNGVYIGEEGHFMQTFDTPDLELLHRNSRYVNGFGTNLNVYTMIAPTATKVYEEKLPTYATPYDEKTFIDTFNEGLEPHIHQVDVYQALVSHKDEPIYYRTDHHWTTLGAYYAYEAFCEAYGIEALPLETFEQKTYSETFYGTLFSKGNFTFAEPDDFQLFQRENPIQMTVTNVNTGEVSDSVYDMTYLDEKDKYSVFLSGNHPLIEIKTEVKNGKKLAIIKDSYANAVIPFLTEHFEEIHVFDMRFLNLNMAEYIKGLGIEDVLLLYNVQNFATMNKFAFLGE